MKRATGLLLILSGLAMFTVGCKKSEDKPKNPDLEKQVRVQVAFDANIAAFKFTWKTQSKTMPEGQANVGKKYPGHFHDMLKHNGTKFDRLPSGQRMDEDRVSFMIDKYDSNIPGWGKTGCAVTCHSGMTNHHLLSENILDHWHWRGGRSGPMGYAEDAAVNNVERIRDNLGTPPTKFTRSGGDRLREDQTVLQGTGHPVLVEGFPRFVFNKGKMMPGNFTIPSFFMANAQGQVITNPYTELSELKDVSKNRTLLVIYQDKSFDPVDKVNAIDLGYLVYVALNSTAHLPAHLRDEASADFTAWKNYWAAELGIAATATQQALDKLNAVHQEWVNSNKNAMVARSVSFIYNSDQHDISSKHEFDVARNEWTVTLYRKINTGSDKDVNLAGLATGQKFTLGFAMHDVGGGAISHNFSLPYVLGTSDDVDVKARNVNDVMKVNWDEVPYFDTFYVKKDFYEHFKEDWLRSSAHPGSSVFETSSCISCHNGSKSLYSGLLN